MNNNDHKKETAMDSELKQKIWKGKVPIQFQMCTSDIASIYPPMCVNILASRFGYLGSVAATAIKYFQAVAVEFSEDIWFESYDQKLNSNLPIGVLYDCIQDQILEYQPWKITIHFQPLRDVSISLDTIGIKQLERIFFHTLKQSLHLLHGTTRLFHELSIESQISLWQAARDGNYLQYQSIEQQLLSHTTVTPSLPSLPSPLPSPPSINYDYLKYIPIRIVTNRQQTTSFLCQKRVPAHIQTNDETVETRNSDGKPEEFLVPQEERTLAMVLQEDFHYSVELIHTSQWICHGIVLPLNIPLVALWQFFHYADFVVYLLVLLAA